MQNMKLKDIFIHSIFFLALIFILSCSSTKENEAQTAETVYNKAMAKFAKEDWLDASQLFDVIKLQYPASQYADDASFYLAEINYKKKEYILSAFNYQMLRKIYPTSEYYKTSIFKTALSYYELSPSYDRDQEYTLKAIEAFQDFQRLYPEDSLFGTVSEYIDKLRDKLGKRAFSNAEIYLKLDSYKAAIVYLDVVIDEFPDTKYLEPAYFLKISSLFKMKKFDDAVSIIDLYKKKYPAGPHIAEISQFEASINNTSGQH